MTRTRTNRQTAPFLLLLASALALSACQFPAFDTKPTRPNTITTPVIPAPTRPPPEARGIWLVGSPALRGAVQKAAAAFDGGPDAKPRLSAGGTTAGFRAFCAGVGLDHPDIVAADRPITPAESKLCQGKGVTLTAYELGPKQILYVKDAHMAAVPGVRPFIDSLNRPGQPVSPPFTGS